MHDMEQFKKDRDEALRSLNKQQIIAYCRKYGAHYSENELVFWASVHKARLAIKSFSESEKRISRKWLLEHGFKADIEM